MKIHYAACLLLILSCIGCRESAERSETTAARNNEGKEFYSKEFNWRIIIPDDFKELSDDEIDTLQGIGKSAIEETAGEEPENRSKSIFVFKDAGNDYFEANHQPFDSTKDGDYEESFRSANAILYETYSSRMPDMQIDSASSTEMIDGLLFQKFSIVVRKGNDKIMTSRLYSRLFDKKEFSANISFKDEAQGRKLTEAWERSSFH